MDFSAYTEVIVDPVVVWMSDEARFAGVGRTQRGTLARELEAELQQAFAREFHANPGAPSPRTLCVRTALTAAIAVPGASDSSVLRYVEIEFELLDGGTNERVAAAVDSKGTNGPSARADATPVEVRGAFRDWAERASIRVSAMRSLDRKLDQAGEGSTSPRHLPRSSE